MDIAEVDQRSGITELAFHKEISHFDWVIVGSFFHYSFNFFEVAHSCTGLDIFEVDVGIISVRQNIAEEEKEALISPVLFKNFD